MKPPTRRFASLHRQHWLSGIPYSGKVYRIFPDSRTASDDLVRIADESGEEYLYHKDHFVFVDFPPTVRKKIPGMRAGLNQKTEERGNRDAFGF